MPITKTISADNYEFMVPGRIDGDMANQLEREIIGAIRSGTKLIYVNLSQANYICSAGIRVLLQYFRQMKSNDKMLRVCRPSSNIEEILDLTGLKDLIVQKTA